MTDHTPNQGIAREPRAQRAILVADSITDLTSAARGHVVVSGSHGAVASGHHAAALAVAGAIFNDAGHGLNGAGSACLAELDSVGLPAAVVAHTSARIGDGQDGLDSGMISACNAHAERLGIRPGDSCRAAADALMLSEAMLAPSDRASFSSSRDQVGPHTIAVLDSASLIDATLIGSIVVTGSHGGLPGSSTDRAVRFPVRFAAFNDAGLGKDNAGVSRLAALDHHGISGVAVSHLSAEIGDGRSTLAQGVVSWANEHAQREGARVGVPLMDLIAQLSVIPPTDLLSKDFDA